jgi:diguanylate cyclase (GGDEF)-like protein
VVDNRAAVPVVSPRSPADSISGPAGVGASTVTAGGPSVATKASASADLIRIPAQRSSAAAPPGAVWRRTWYLLRGTAVAAAIGGVAHTLLTGAELPSPLVLAATAALIVLGHILTVPVRTGTGRLRLGWGEAALIVACYLVPVGLVPGLFLVSVGLHQYCRLYTGRLTVRYRAINNTAALTVSAAGAAATAALIGLRPWADLDGRTVLALSAGAAVFLVLSAFIVAGLATIEYDQRPLRVARTMIRTKVPMAVGNVVVAVAMIAGFGENRLWLLILPPALWLLHQTFTFRANTEDERRSWQTFAEATRELNHLDEDQAAAAGLDGAVRLFAATGAEIVIDGSRRVYTIASDGVVTCTDDSAGTLTDPGPGRLISNRPLLVGGARIGELRILSPQPVNRRDALMLNAYGDALAASLHDAATNSELRALTERSDHDANHDPLTGLINRSALLVRGTARLRGLDTAVPVALLLLDINHFKEVNTTLGHAAGDSLLAIIAERLLARSKPGDLVVRLGGDEFAVLFGGADAQLSDAVERARLLAADLARPTSVADVQLSVEASIGVVAAVAGEIDVTELLRRADIAMYQAKRSGASVSWYEADHDNASTDRLALLAELREALAGRDQLHLVFQPVVGLPDQRPVSVEAFVRWQHPRRGTLTPVHFVRAVEQSELLGQFTRYVLDAALAFAAELRAGGTVLPVSVNLSPRSLHDRQLPADVAHLLHEHDIPPNGLILEITETVVLSEDQVVDEVLASLRKLGVQLSVDDFGTGCSALTFLTRVALDEVKVDRTFVLRMVEQPEAEAIVRTTVELGRALGRRVVAEGVENAEQCAALVALGCTTAQGFHFAKPMPASAAVEALRSGTPRPGTPRPTGVTTRHLRAAE